MPRQLATFMSRSRKCVTITADNIESIRNSPIDRAVTHVLYQVLGHTLCPYALSRFPHALYLIAPNCGFKTLDGLLLNGKQSGQSASTHGKQSGQSASTHGKQSGQSASTHGKQSGQSASTHGMPVMPLLICIDVSMNRLRTLRGIQYQYWLIKLIVKGCKLPTLAYLEGAYRLEDLDCRLNPITNYSALLYLKDLYDFAHTASPETIANQHAPITAILKGNHNDCLAFNYYMHDSAFQQSADLLALLVLRAPCVDPNPLSMPVPLIPGLRTLCTNPTLHHTLKASFATLIECLWARIAASGIDIDDITEAFGDHMIHAQYLEIEHLFRYTVSFLPNYFNETRVSYSKVTGLDMIINAAIRDNAEANNDTPYLSVFYALSAAGQHFSTATSIISTMVERELSRTDQSELDFYEEDYVGSPPAQLDPSQFTLAQCTNHTIQSTGLNDEVATSSFKSIIGERAPSLL